MTDSYLEDETRGLLRAAVADLPGDGAIDTAAVRRRVAARRRRTRAAVSGAAVTSAVTGMLIAGAVGPAAPSADATLQAATSATADQSFALTVTASWMLNGRTIARHVDSGTFDPVGDVGTMDDGRVLIAHGFEYLKISPRYATRGKLWVKVAAPELPPISMLPQALSLDAGGPVSPQSLLELLRATADVRQTGTTARGWTAYAYSETRNGARITGTVQVDQRGLVRQLVTVIRINAIATEPGAHTPPDQPVPAILRTQADFSSFGIAVSVTVPPDSECVIIGA